MGPINRLVEQLVLRGSPRMRKGSEREYGRGVWGHYVHHIKVTEMRYLGIYFVQSRKLKCSLDAAKRGFYRAANSIFSEIGRTASEEVILQSISSKLCQS